MVYYFIVMMQSHGSLEYEKRLQKEIRRIWQKLVLLIHFHFDSAIPLLGICQEMANREIFLYRLFIAELFLLPKKKETT